MVLLDPALPRKIADVAEKYGAKYLSCTGAQRIAIIGIQEEDLDNVWAEFDDRSKAIGLTIRSIQICPGTRACKKAKQDSPGLGFALDKEFYGKPAPAKFKMGISGCSNCCSDSWMKDLGFFGTDEGSRRLPAAKVEGRRNRTGDCAGLTGDQAIALATRSSRSTGRMAQPPNVWAGPSSGSVSTHLRKPCSESGPPGTGFNFLH